MKFFVLTLLCLALLAGCSPSTSTSSKNQGLPSVDDPAMLARDCAILGADTNPHPIAQELWPDSVKKLNPVAVEREENGIFITILGSTDTGSEGYAVAVMKPADNAHYTITDTPYTKIYRFDFKP